MARQSQNNGRRPVLVVVVLVIAAVLLFTGINRRHVVTPVRAERAVREEIASVISTNGKIEPIDSFEAHAPAPATVNKVLVKEGDHVKAGQLLVELDDADARSQAAHALAQLRAAEAALSGIKAGGTQEELLTSRADLTKAQAERDEAQRNLQAIQQLQQSGGASPAEVEAAQNRLKKAEADLQLLQAKAKDRYSSPEVAKVEASAAEARAAYAAAQDLLQHSNVRAPFAGTVYQLPVRPGAYVNAGELLVQVANLEKVRVRAFVDEPEIGRLAKGQKVEIKWDAIPGRTWEGTLTRVPTSVTMVGTRTVGEITSEVDNADRKLLPNVNVNVSIIAARHDNALTVSREAVHDVDGKRYVYEIVNDKILAQEVQTGLSSLTRVEVVKGVPEGALIALGAINAQPLRNGMDIKVVER
ncbi:MAG TPA: efflux RND transporter periplasmic adaptor subunit [Candidatus Acidoferrales bacterium]|nr:efflux RND transporter periplasmic adaptor subunit [Candidatus Acidoferrales bacterium]